MVCKCGYQNEPDDFYCAQCGRRLSPGKKSGKGWIIAIVIVLALAAGALAAWYLIPWEKPAEEPGETQEQTLPENEIQDPTAVRPDDVASSGEAEEPREGWDEDHVCYYEDGEPVKGLKKLADGYYYFDPETGENQTGWVEIDGAWHYFTEAGPAPGEGWYSDEEGWFYLQETGELCTESSFLDKANKREYFLDETGYLTKMTYLELICIEADDEVNGLTRPVLMLTGTLTDCTSLTYHQTEAMSITPVEAPVWEIWIRLDSGEWQKITDSPTPDGDGGFEVKFSQPRTFDAICIIGSKDQRVKSTLTSVTVDY